MDILTDDTDSTVSHKQPLSDEISKLHSQGQLVNVSHTQATAHASKIEYR
jgi:hypothetical protein